MKTWASFGKWVSNFLEDRREYARQEFIRNNEEVRVPLRNFVTYYEDEASKFRAEKVLWDAAVEHYQEHWEKIEPNFEFFHDKRIYEDKRGKKFHVSFCHKGGATTYIYWKPKAGAYDRLNPIL